jgi:hypothetical protein
VKLTLIKTLENPFVGDLWYDDTSTERFDLEDRLNEAFDQSDIIKVYLTDGHVLLAAKHNKNGGVCGCCSEFNNYGKITKAEFFKLD